jgi:hypothetical protein
MSEEDHEDELRKETLGLIKSLANEIEVPGLAGGFLGKEFCLISLLGKEERLKIVESGKVIHNHEVRNFLEELRPKIHPYKSLIANMAGKILGSYLKNMKFNPELMSENERNFVYSILSSKVFGLDDEFLKDFLGG